MPRVTLAALLALAGFAGAAQAQPVPGNGGLQSPTVSPYIGLLNRGYNPALNYLSIVRPQQQLAQQFNQLQQQNQQNAAAIQGQLALGADPTLPQTGVVGRFNSTGGYFSRHPVTGTGGAGGGRVGGIGATGNLFANNRIGAGVGTGTGAVSGAAGVGRR